MTTCRALGIILVPVLKVKGNHSFCMVQVALARPKFASSSLKKVLACKYLSNVTPIDNVLIIQGFPTSFGLRLVQSMTLNLDSCR